MCVFCEFEYAIATSYWELMTMIQYVSFMFTANIYPLWTCVVDVE